MSELNVVLLKLFHIVVRAFLVLASALWLLILLELLPVLAYGGMEGVHGKLLHIWSMDKIDFDLPWTCENSLRLVHEGYTDIILFLLLTWAALELKRFLQRQIAEYGRLSRISTDTP